MNLFPNNPKLSELLQNLSDMEIEPWETAIKALDSTADLDLLKEILGKELNTGRLCSHKAFYWLDDRIGDRKQTLLIKETQNRGANRSLLEDCFGLDPANKAA
jgi:hypothetical protein